jgi:hypothetical protein
MARREKRLVDDREREQILRALEQGQKVVDVARLYNRGERTVREIAHAAGVELPSRQARVRHYEDLPLRVPANIFNALTLAANRRNATASRLAVELLAGVLCRGSIECALNGRSKIGVSALQGESLGV